MSLDPILIVLGSLAVFLVLVGSIGYWAANHHDRNMNEASGAHGFVSLGGRRG